jgi:hypothetical protein
MLFCNVLMQRRVAVEQKRLQFLEVPCPHEALWAQLDDEQRAFAIEVLSRLMAQTQLPVQKSKENSDER